MSKQLVTVKGQVSAEERDALLEIAKEETRSLSQVLRLAVRELLASRQNGG